MKYDDVLKRYQPTIGIECHVQLSTATKLFSGADNDARDKPVNTTVSPICFGFPGVLPVLNQEVLTLAIRAGLALKAVIPEISRFERKHYFYPDLPKGYQITQLAEPVIVGGEVNAPQIDGGYKKVRLHHAHIEEDAGKLVHPVGASESYVDLNRAGTPLIEIVSEPDMHSPAEARAFTQELYRLMTYAGVTHGDLFHGNMRFDVNISLAPLGSDQLGTRAEIKNLNSFRSVEKAAEYEAIRQAETLDSKKQVTQETRGWDEATQKTISQRSKSDAHDYRYFPDADIPPVRIGPELVQTVMSTMPDLPDVYRTAWRDLGLDASVINSLLGSRQTARLILDVQKNAGNEHAARVAHWFVSALEDSLPQNNSGQLDSARFVALSHMVADASLSSTSAKRIFNEMLKTDSSPQMLAEEYGLLQISDESAIGTIVDQVLADPGSKKALADVRAGNDKAIGFLVGQVMKLSKGTANPGLADRLIRSRL